MLPKRGIRSCVTVFASMISALRNSWCLPNHVFANGISDGWKHRMRNDAGELDISHSHPRRTPVRAGQDPSSSSSHGDSCSQFDKRKSSQLVYH
uniref:Uncharacterized protein n=1 Tax=Arundo donax TaxID=35708 RepID=A0A0A9FT41_ARUDO